MSEAPELLGLDVRGRALLGLGKAEVIGERGSVPRGLLALGLLDHVDAHLLEHLFDGQARRRHQPGQRAGEGAVRSGAVQRDASRRGGIGKEGAGGRLHLGKALFVEVGQGAERVVAAGVEDHDVGAVPRRVHLAQHRLHVERDQPEVGGVDQLDIDGQQVIRPEGLDPVPGVVEQPRRTAAGLAQLAPELDDATGQAGAVDVDQLDHLEPQRLQRLGDGLGIAGGVGERRDVLVVGVADHERKARFRPQRSAEAQDEQGQDKGRT